MFYVIKLDEKYLRYSPYGLGIEWVDKISEATIFDKIQIAKICCDRSCKIFELDIVEKEM